MLNFEGINGKRELGNAVDSDSVYLLDDVTSSCFADSTVAGATPMLNSSSSIQPDPLFSPEELDSVLGMDQVLSQHVNEEESMFTPQPQSATQPFGVGASHPNSSSSWMENFSCAQHITSHGRYEGDIAKPATIGSSSVSPSLGVLHNRFSKEDRTKFGDKYIKGNSGAATSSSRSDTWAERFEELKQFKAEHGHCCVPNSYEPNIVLGRWVKRQRYQYKLLQDNKRSSLTLERKSMLESLGFIWDSHDAIWEERLRELHAFRDLHGHCKVPSSYPSNQELAIWAKRQRRLFKIYCTKVANANESSPLRASNAMTLQRILKLANAGFIFNNLESHGALETLAKIAGGRRGNINCEPSTKSSTITTTPTDIPSISTTINNDSNSDLNQIVSL